MRPLESFLKYYASEVQKLAVAIPYQHDDVRLMYVRNHALMNMIRVDSSSTWGRPIITVPRTPAAILESYAALNRIDTHLLQSKPLKYKEVTAWV